MAYLHVRRGTQTSGAIRKLKVFVDGQEAGAVKRGETTRLTVQPGDHEVYVKMDWVRSRALTITAAEGTDVRVLAVLPQRREEVIMSVLRPRQGLKLRLE